MAILRGILVLLLLAGAGPVLRAEDGDDNIERLKKELAELRAENERLRKALMALLEKKPAPEPIRSEREAAAALEKRGAVLNQGGYRPGDVVDQLSFNDLPVTDRDLAGLEHLSHLGVLNLAHSKVSNRGLDHLRGLTDLRELNFAATGVTDAGLERLKGLSNLSTLSLANTPVTGAGLVHLKKLGQLRRLNLNETDLRDAGMEHLAGIKPLWILNLNRTDISDAGLAHLAKLERLEKLELDNTGITDAGLKHLKGLRRLQTLSVIGTKVTDKGVAELKESLPKLVVIQKNITPQPRPFYRPPYFPMSSMTNRRFGPFPPGR
jgi:hypothetical protein